LDIFSLAPVHAALEAAYIAVTALGTALAPFAGASSVAAAIAVTTLLVRLALLPLGIVAARTSAATRRLAPRVDELRRRYKKSPERLQREMLALYRSEGVSPGATVLPLLAQLPIVGVVYALFTHATIGDHSNQLFANTLAGVSLGPSLGHTAIVGDLSLGFGVIVGVVVVLVVISAETSRRTIRSLAAGTPPRQSQEQAVVVPPAVTKVLEYLPYLTILAAVLVPLAAAIYVVISALWGAIERAVLTRRFAARTPSA